MPILKQLLFVPLLGGSLAFACGGDARPANPDTTRRPTPAASQSAQAGCPSEADVSRVLGSAVKFTRQGTACMYVTDDESYSADMMLGGAGSGAQLMSEVREEAQGRKLATEAPGFGDQGVIWAGPGNASGAVVGNGKSAFVNVTMQGKDATATKTALLTLLRMGIE